MIRLNLGCGKVRLDGFINIDSNPDINPDVIGNVAEVAGYPAESVDEIVAFDIIEHFDRMEFPKVLRHWFKLLKVDGVLHLRTPDIDRLIRLYAINLFCHEPSVMSVERLVWHLFSEHETQGMGHKWIFNKQSMATALTDAGFQSVEFLSDAEMSCGRYPYASGEDHVNLYAMVKKKDVVII